MTLPEDEYGDVAHLAKDRIGLHLFVAWIRREVGVFNNEWCEHNGTHPSAFRENRTPDQWLASFDKWLRGEWAAEVKRLHNETYRPLTDIPWISVAIDEDEKEAP